MTSANDQLPRSHSQPGQRLIPAKVIFKPNDNPKRPAIGRHSDGKYVVQCTDKKCKRGCGVYIPRTDGEPEPVLLELRQGKRTIKVKGGYTPAQFYTAHKDRPSTQEKEKIKQMKAAERSSQTAIVPPPPFSVCVIPLTTEGQMGGAHLIGYKNLFLGIDCGGFANTQDYGEGARQIQTAYRGLKKIERMWGEGNKPHIKAFGITHGHLDHHSNLKKVIPLTASWNDGEPAAVLRTQITDAFISKSLTFDGYEPLPKGPDNKWVFETGQDFRIGDFHVTSFGVPHSIPQSVGYLIEVAGKRIVVLGDYKFLVPDPLETEQFRQELDEIGSKPVDALICEALGVDEEGRTPDESVAMANIRRHIEQEVARSEEEGRSAVVRFACFSSSLYKIKEVLKMCREFNLRPFFEGRAMEDALYIGRQLFGFRPLEAEIQKKILAEGENGVLYFNTGCQGEKGSQLWRLTHRRQQTAMGKEFSKVGFEETVHEIAKNDFVIISARVIPDNEQPVMEIINGVTERGGRVLLDSESVTHLKLPKDKYAHDNINVSGHGRSEDFMELYTRLKPEVVIPYHGTGNTPEKIKELLPEEEKDKVVTPERLRWIEI